MNLRGFIGPSNTQRSSAFDCEETINLILEQKQAGNPKSEWYAYGAPGLIPRYGLPSGPVRGEYTVDGRAWAVGGTAFCELFANDTYIQRGTVAVDGSPVSWACNGTGGNQLMLTSGGVLYCFNLQTSAFQAVTDYDFLVNVAQVEFLGSSFIVRIRHSNLFYYSDVLDGLLWNGLQFFRTSLTADNKLSMIANHGYLWLHGTQRSEIWEAVANSATPFQPSQGTIIEHGSVAAWSATRMDNSIFWLGGDERGANMVLKADGFSPARVSTNAVETYLNKLPRTSDAIGFAYQEEGHAFYLLYVPSADTTLCYDSSTGQWTKRAFWNSTLMQWEPFWGRNHIFAFGKHLLGDRQSGTVYQSDLAYYRDARRVA